MLDGEHTARGWRQLVRSAGTLLAAATTFAAGADGVMGQARPASPVSRAAVSPANEIALARSAAPASISAAAAVYVLVDGRYRLAQEGTNGFTCFVLRDADPRAQYPTCLDPEWTRCELPEYMKEAELRRSGMAETRIAAVLDGLRRAGRFPRPRRSGIAYMASPHMRGMYDVVPGGRIQPHVMIYAPGATNAQIGVSDVATARLRHIPFVLAEGRPDAHIIAALPSYADGTAIEGERQ